MKYAVLIGDGMADYPIPDLGNRTPLELARTPALDLLARSGAGGTVRTVPDGMEPASDVANLAILGVDPSRHYTGRGPLEAASMGIDLEDDEMAFRCNLVTVSDGRMADYSGGHISSAEARVLIEILAGRFAGRGVRFQSGVGYRHLLVVPRRLLEDGEGPLRCVPPHDITGKAVAPHLPAGRGGRFLREIMQASHVVLAGHPVNRVKVDLGENPANMIWLWGGGGRPQVTTFRESRGIDGAVICAVDLIKGIGRVLGMEVVDVPGATGYYDTDYAAKGRAAVEALGRVDFVLVHVEAADEASHNGDRSEKVRAIEQFDAKVVAPVVKALRAAGEFRVLALPDHATPLALRTHVADPVPFAVCGTGVEPDRMTAFSERAALRGSLVVGEGWRLMDRLLGPRPAEG
ncbi:MAG: cofactor-independent phosphoglycerate mutase [bacterium]|nr:cofactor-independent phosphoglycerate mutase [bacterium]